MPVFDANLCGARIRSLRKQAGMTQANLCDALAVKGGPGQNQSISDYERGKSSPPLATLAALSDIFHVTVDYLIGISNDPNPFAAEVSKYTGLSPEAAKVLNETLAAEGGTDRSISILNDLILNPNFQIALFSMSLLRRRKDDVGNVKLEPVPDSPEVAQMRGKHAIQVQKYLLKEFGIAHVLTGIDVVHYEANQVLNRLKDAVTAVCDIRKTEHIWQQKCAEARYGKSSKKMSKNRK